MVGRHQPFVAAMALLGTVVVLFCACALALWQHFFPPVISDRRGVLEMMYQGTWLDARQPGCLVEIAVRGDNLVARHNNPKGFGFGAWHPNPSEIRVDHDTNKIVHAFFHRGIWDQIGEQKKAMIH